MPIGVIGAMDEEVALLRADMTNIREYKHGHRSYYQGLLYGKNVVLVFSRWGKVAAASTATTLIERFNVGSIVFSGVAGAASEDLEIGDIVIGTELIQHDMDASPLFPKYEIPLLGKSRLKADTHLVSKAQSAAERFLNSGLACLIDQNTLRDFGIERPKVVSGLIASGDQFISDSTTLAAIRTSLTNLQSVEMEGASVAQVCVEHEVPFCVIRYISDRANHSAQINFSQFISDVASEYSQGVLTELFPSL